MTDLTPEDRALFERICPGNTSLTNFNDVVIRHDQLAQLLDAARTEGRESRPSGGVPITDEITEDAIRSKAKAYLMHMGWGPGMRPGLHSVIELMTRFGVDCRKITDRCAYPECGCDHDAICASAVEKLERVGGEGAQPEPVKSISGQEQLAAMLIEVIGLDDEPIYALQTKTPMARRCWEAAGKILAAAPAQPDAEGGEK